MVFVLVVIMKIYKLEELLYLKLPANKILLDTITNMSLLYPVNKNNLDKLIHYHMINRFLKI